MGLLCRIMPSIWAIADLHLSFGTANKSMDIFGPRWVNHAERVKQHWCDLVLPEDLVLIAGDISWAKLASEAAADLEWIHTLPGIKLLLRGNHDYWWGSASSVAKLLPPSMAIIQNNATEWQGMSIGGSRLWDTPEYSFSDFIQVQATAAPAQTMEEDATTADQEKIFLRELHRLDLSLRELNPAAATRIALTHYPPIGANLAPSRASALLEKYRVDICVFGHLHNIPPGQLPFGTSRGVAYHLTACDYLQCTPLKVLEL